MKFPRSLRDANAIMRDAFKMTNLDSVKPDVNATDLGVVPGSSGTRASSQMGHMFHPGDKQTLYQSMDITQYDFGDGPQMGNPDEIITTSPWPPNAANWKENPGGGRQEQSITSGGLQTGPPPGRILRQLYDRVHGNDGAMTGQPYGTGGSLPYQESWQYMAHLKVPRQALGTKGPQKLADDNAYIPAVFAGNPRIS